MSIREIHTFPENREHIVNLKNLINQKPYVERKRRDGKEEANGDKSSSNQRPPSGPWRVPYPPHRPTDASKPPLPSAEQSAGSR